MLIPLFNELNTLNNSILNYKKYISLFNFNTIFTAASFSNIYNEQMKKKKNPISGIRIEFSGPPKKAERSKIIAYHDVIQDYRLIGKMPTHSIYADIHYYQSYIKLKRSTFGIKVWLFYNTRILNIHNINKTIL
jgi:ribosomal protein S3